MSRRRKPTAALAEAERSGDMWRDILEHYDRWYSRGDGEIAWFQAQPSLHAAIEIAARATDERGRRYGHQTRIRREAITQATAALLAVERQIAQAANFDALLALIRAQLQEVAGIGKLYCYDTAFRIGAYRRLFPERVYLHAGTRDGARVLNLDYKKDSLAMDEVPAALRHRRPYEIEDILCIYKGRFSGQRRVAVRC